MDEKQSAIICIIMSSIIIYICISILFCFLPKLLWSKKRVFDDPQQDDGERRQKRKTEFEKLVSNGVEVLEYNVEVTGDDVYVIHTENKTVDQVSSKAEIEVENQNDDTKSHVLDKQEVRTPFKDVLENTVGKPIIIRVTETDVIQLKKVIFHIREKNRLDSVILGSDSKPVINSLCKLGAYVPIYRKPDWKLYLLYFVGFLPMWPFEPSVLLLSHRSETGIQGRLRRWMFLLIHGPMIMHLRRRGIRTYIIVISKDSYQVPGSVSLVLVPDRFDLDLLTPRCNQTDCQNESHIEKSTDSNADTIQTIDEGQVSWFQKKKRTLWTKIVDFRATNVRSNTNEEENVSEEGNHMQNAKDEPSNSNETDDISEKGRADLNIHEEQTDEPNAIDPNTIEISNVNKGGPNLHGTSEIKTAEVCASPPSNELCKQTESELCSETSRQEFERNSKQNFPI